jgi:hypothetical protein
LHDVAVGGLCEVFGGHHAAVGAGARWGDVDHRGFDVQHIAGPGRARPGNFAPAADNALGQGHAAGHKQPHAECCGVPAAGGQAAEEGRYRCLFIGMEGLRVEFFRKRLDVVGGNRLRPGDKSVAWLEIVQIIGRNGILGHSASPHRPRA